MSIELDLSPQVAVVWQRERDRGGYRPPARQAGAAVAIADLSLDSAARVADDINASGGKVLAVPVDIPI